MENLSTHGRGFASLDAAGVKLACLAITAIEQSPRSRDFLALRIAPQSHELQQGQYFLQPKTIDVVEVIQMFAVDVQDGDDALVFEER